MVKQGIILRKFTDVNVQDIYFTEADEALIYPNYRQLFISESAPLGNFLLPHFLTRSVMSYHALLTNAETS